MNRYIVTFRCRKAGSIGLHGTSVYSKTVDAPDSETATETARLACFEAGYEHTSLFQCSLVRGKEPEVKP